MKKLDSETKIRITWWKIRPGDPKIWVRWVFELCEFEFKEFSCMGLLLNSEGTKEFVQFRWSFELQEFELHEFNGITNISMPNFYFLFFIFIFIFYLFIYLFFCTIHFFATFFSPNLNIAKLSKIFLLLCW